MSYMAVSPPLLGHSYSHACHVPSGLLISPPVLPLRLPILPCRAMQGANAQQVKRLEEAVEKLEARNRELLEAFQV